MEPSKMCDTVLAEDTDDFFDDNSIYFATPDTVCVAESQDLFAEDTNMSVEAQQTIDVCANSSAVTQTDPFEGPSGNNVTPGNDWLNAFQVRHRDDFPSMCPTCLPTCLVAAKGIECIVHSSELTKTDPKEGPSGKSLRLTCEDYLKDSSSSDSGAPSDNDDDDDETPDLDVDLLLSKFKSDNSENSKEQGEVEKGPCHNLTQKRVESHECENVGHSLNENQESDESDVTIISDTIAVDCFKCNYENCVISHRARYVKEPDTHNDEHETPSLGEFMESTVSLKGSEVIGLMSFYAHRLRACKLKLIQEYNIAPHIVERWMDML